MVGVLWIRAAVLFGGYDYGIFKYFLLARVDRRGIGSYCNLYAKFFLLTKKLDSESLIVPRA